MLINHPYLAMRFRLDGVVTLVDAVNGMATLDAHEEARRQVVAADRLVLTKADLVPGIAALAPLRLRLAELNPGLALLGPDPPRPHRCSRRALRSGAAPRRTAPVAGA